MNQIRRAWFINIRRYLSTHERHLEINFKKKISKYYYIWLRDHCRCDVCYNKRTFQIASNINKIPINIKPKSCKKTDSELIINWPDDHTSKYPLDWLSTIEVGLKKNSDIKLWNNRKVLDFKDTEVKFNQMKTDDGVRTLLTSIIKYGFGFVTGAPNTMKATEDVAKKICFIRKTLFGEMWAEVLDDYKYNDTAYITTALGAHTDNTYFSEASGLQVIHILSHEGTGGETILVDGFNAAKILQRTNKDAFDILCRHAFESQYIAQNIHYSSTDYAIRLHPVTRELLQIRYNIYDRAALVAVPSNMVVNFYEAYKALGGEINKPENEWKFKLEPGRILFIDNWRVLHGRAAYTGNRRLTGCYLGRGPWLSKAKALGLENL